MFKLYVLLALIAFANAGPVTSTTVAMDDTTDSVTERKTVEIVQSGMERNADGSYSFHFEGADGTSRQETAIVHGQGTKDEQMIITGTYSFINADGEKVVVKYTADGNGFVPVGNNIPQEISVAAKVQNEHAIHERLSAKSVDDSDDSDEEHDDDKDDKDEDD